MFDFDTRKIFCDCCKKIKRHKIIGKNQEYLYEQNLKTKSIANSEICFKAKLAYALATGFSPVIYDAQCKKCKSICQCELTLGGYKKVD